MNRRMDITSIGHKIEVDTYTLYVDVKMHLDKSDEMDIATIDTIKVTQIFDSEKRKNVDRIHQHP